MSFLFKRNIEKDEVSWSREEIFVGDNGRGLTSVPKISIKFVKFYRPNFFYLQIRETPLSGPFSTKFTTHVIKWEHSPLITLILSVSSDPKSEQRSY